MLKLKKIYISFIFLISIIFIPFCSNVYAFEANYSVEAIIPDNQIDKDVSYFSLKVEPNQSQNLNIVVHNVGVEEANIILEPHNASTNDNGVIIYNEAVPVDASLKIPFTSILSEKQMVHLKPSESKTVSFKLKMPEEKFDGMILGGFRIYEQEDQKDKTNESLQIKNKVEYEISVKLIETDKNINPNINLLDVFAGLNNYKTSIFAKLQNDKPTVIENLSVEAKIFKEGSNKILYKKSKEGMKMAPNSNFRFPIDLGDSRIEPGKYVAKISAKNHDYDWKFEKTFEIKEREAKEFNEEAINIDDSKEFDNSVYLLVFLMVVIVLLIILLVFRRK